MGEGGRAATGLVDGAPLAGVVVQPLTAHTDRRGSFTEVFAAERDTGVEPTQWSVVRSEPGALRGMHLHLGHDEYLTVVGGRLYVGLHDLRRGSPTEGQGALYVLDHRAPASLTFPRGLVHGWLADGSTVHLQAVSESYSSYSSHDNDGCRWDDPDLGITWPFEPRLLSDRAASFGTLAELRDRALVVSQPG
jgi:dTDP-4-dehydrorhamnose 3,5-epimerase